MKKSLMFFTCAAVLSICCSCSKEEPAQILLKTRNIDCPATAAEYPVSFSANYEWTASSSVSWAKLSETSGMAGEVSIMLSVSEPDLNERSGLVIISCRDARDTVTLCQRQLDRIILNKQEVQLTSAGGQFDVTVSTNVSYKVTIPAECSWLTLNSTKAYGDETVSFTCLANTTYDDRETKVLFTSADGKLRDTLSVRQSQFDEILISEHQVTLSSDGGSFSIVSSSNIGFKVEIPSEITWLRRIATKGLVDETVLFECDPNTSFDDRMTSVFFTSEDGIRYDTLEVRQRQLDRLEFLSESLSFGSDGGTASIEIESNVEYEIIVPESASWLTVTSTAATKSLVKDAYSVTCAKNDDYDARSTSVIVKQAGGALSDTLSVSQAPHKPSLLKFGCTGTTVTSPVITGTDKLSGTTDWGDGSREAYKAGSIHTYQTSEDHDVIIEISYCEDVTFDVVVGLEYVDFSDF